jgi:hypothetical protein
LIGFSVDANLDFNRHDASCSGGGLRICAAK